MRIIKDPQEMRSFSQKTKTRHKTIGFVPTMGALHEGHLSLVSAAKEKSDVVVVSIFINPIQFGPSEDYANYPRDLKADMRLLKNFDVDVVFIPDASKMFPEGPKTFVEVEGLSKKMCGRTRPTHFRGVTTIVATLFNIVCPDFAFFGEKDFQQQVIIKRMVKGLNFPVKIHSLPTVREYDGLAMSSRNKYLTPGEHKSALIFYKVLTLAKEEIESGGKDLRKIIMRMRALIGSEPSVRLDYVILADPETLEEVKKIKGKVLIAVAAHLGKARLIDNMVVKAP